MQLTDDIKYKLHFILDKKRCNKKLTSEEENYLKRYNEFLKILSRYKIYDMKEIKETLEDKFLSFYNENKTFEGV